jgi:hypothetical protein
MAFGRAKDGMSEMMMAVGGFCSCSMNVFHGFCFICQLAL